MTKTVTFGYWRQHKDQKESDLPWPEITIKPDTKFIEKAQSLEAKIFVKFKAGKPRYKKVFYRGFSRSRLTGKLLGSSEWQLYENGVWYIWPVDYVSHYLKAGVAPDPEFVALVNRNI